MDVVLAGSGRPPLALGMSSCVQPSGAAPGAEGPPGAASVDGDTAEFSDCYRRGLPGLVWFVMSLGAAPEAAADAAQSAFAAAFPVWRSIQHPSAWLRRVAQRAYYRSVANGEACVEALPDRPGHSSVDGTVEFRDEARDVLAALQALAPKQRQVMAWYVDGYSPAEIARELGADQAAVRQNLAKARKNLKRLLGIPAEGADVCLR